MRRDDSQARIYYDLLVSRLSARARREVGNMIDLRKWRPLSKEGKQVWNEMKAEARALGHREGFEDGFEDGFEKAQFEALTEVLTLSLIHI